MSLGYLKSVQKELLPHFKSLLREFHSVVCMQVPRKGEFFKTAVAAKERRRMHFCKDNWLNTCWLFFLPLQKTIFFSTWNIDFSFLFDKYGLYLTDLVCF